MTSPVSKFLGSHPAKFDAKGRVLIPAPFRAALRNEAGTSSMIALPSDTYRCIECWPRDGFDRLTSELEPLSRLGMDREDWAATFFSDATLLESDKEGRIVLPATLLETTDITDTMLFMGMGEKFQIWEPVAGEHRKRESRDRTASLRRLLVKPA